MSETDKDSLIKELQERLEKLERDVKELTDQLEQEGSKFYDC